MAERSKIEIRGAREHNLKNIDLDIARGQMTVITGVSGSGKSSLAFDTILAESRRRFFYTLSHYSRQFLDLSTRPLVRSIKGISPSVYLAQNETPPSRRASVATLTDLGELLGVLYSLYGQRLCPEHRLPTASYTAESMTDQLIQDKGGEMLILCSPIAEAKKGHFKSVLMGLAAKGFLRVWIDGEIRSLEPIPMLSSDKKHTLKLIVDGLRIKPESRQRILRGIQSALEASEGYLEWYPCDAKGEMLLNQGGRYSLKGGCPTCGYSWPRLDPRYFAANSLGKCQVCSGRGYKTSGEDDSAWDSAVEDDEESTAKKSTEGADFSLILCHDCHGTGLKAELDGIHLRGVSIRDLHLKTFSDLADFVETLRFLPNFIEHKAVMRVLSEIMPIVQRIIKIGLGYLCLSRRLFTLSAGELQRIKLAGLLGGRLRGVLYVLDEPSQGLHASEVEQIAKALLELKNDGSTVIVVDHDEGFMRHADFIIDLGPGGGRTGGEIVARFRPVDAAKYADRSVTAKNLATALKENAPFKVQRQPKGPKKPNGPYLELRGGDHQIHNLKIESAYFPLGALTVVTGVSGAGKSSLVLDTLYPMLARQMEGGKPIELQKSSIDHHSSSSMLNLEHMGDKKILKVDLIDRRKIAKSGVSIPASYLDILGELRDLFAKLPDAQILGLTARHFSLAVEGGRCKECKGRGVISLKMKFLADAQVICSSCQGQRFMPQVLGVRYQNHHLAEYLEMSLSELADKLVHHKKIQMKIAPALELGLGYLKVGQPTASLSGGEAQRLKLAPYFYLGALGSKRMGEGSLLILDEPTTGLHKEDARRLITVLKSIVAKGATVIAIEHHEDLIREADWNIELGPGAADKGGHIVVQGPPN